MMPVCSLHAKCVLAQPTLSETEEKKKNKKKKREREKKLKALAHLFLIKKPNKEQALLF